MALDGDEVDDDDDRDMFCIPPSLWVNGVYIPQRRRGRGGESPRVGVPKMFMLGIQQEVSTSELCAKRHRAMSDTSAQSNLRHNAVAGTIQLAQQLAPEEAQKQLCELVASGQ